MNLQWLLLAVICTGVAGDTKYRLNSKMIPSAYEITIRPFLDTGDANAFTFTGQVVIKVNTTYSDVKRIKLHSNALKFGPENVIVREGTKVMELNSDNPVDFEIKYNFVYINLAESMTINTDYEIDISYKGAMKNTFNGLYRTSYPENGNIKWLAASHLEPVYAREVFPSFDEPEYKATFTLIIDRPEHFSTSLANTKLRDTTILNDGYVRERFYPSPIMSCYLVSFVVSELETGDNIVSGDRQIAVWSRPQATEQGKYAFEFAKKVVEGLGNYTNVDYYSVDKNLNYNHVAIRGFPGAMENWGLVQYAESSLLYEESECAPSVKAGVASIIGHEVAHQWFGNLVTCHWWSNTWLNEGFATYFQDYIVSLIDPSLGAQTKLVTSSSYSAAKSDETPDAPPLTHTDVNSPSEIKSAFDGISYQKGGTIIRMIHHIIGDAAFRTGLSRYLNNNELSVATPEQLYTALQTGVSYENSMASYPGLTVSEFMDSWVSQAGHPLVTVSVSDCALELTQNRFYKQKNEHSDELYWIPFTMATKSDPDFNRTKPIFIWNSRKYTHKTDCVLGTSDDEWVIINVQDAGYYRVNYEKKLWRRIAVALKGEDRELIHSLNRAKLVTDLFELAYAEHIPFSLVFEVLDYLHLETDYAVWSTVISYLRTLSLGIRSVSKDHQIMDFFSAKLENIIRHIGFEVKDGDDFETLTFRSTLMTFACDVLNHKECIKMYVNTFRLFRDDNTAVPPSLRQVVYCHGLRQGSEEDLQAMIDRSTSTNYLCENQVITRAIYCSPHTQAIQRYLELRMSNPSHSGTNILDELSIMLQQEDQFETAFLFLQQYYAAIKNEVPVMSDVIKYFVNAAVTFDQLNELKHWFNSCVQCKKEDLEPAQQLLEKREKEINWIRTHLSDIATALHNVNSAEISSMPRLTVAAQMTGVAIVNMVM